MSQAVILGITGETGLWLADLQSQTITAIDEPLSDELSKAVSLRASGVTPMKGVDFAIAVSATQVGAGSVHEGAH